jgi:Protein of unknown function (DUF3347)
MRKFVLLGILFIVAGLLVYRLLSDKKPAQGPPPDQALKISKNSTGFDSAFAGLMNQYYSVRNALVDWDTLRADQAAYRMAGMADSLPVRLLKADSGIVMTAKSLAASIVGEAKGFVGETGIEARRHSFDMMTSELYDLVRAVQYDGEKIYHIRCPMAFGDSAEAFWLSNSAEIINPYLGNKHPTYGKKMIGCGLVIDSLDFAKK